MPGAFTPSSLVSTPIVSSIAAGTGSAPNIRSASRWVVKL
jgi:hypothetical protein